MMNPYGEVNYDASIYQKLMQQPSNDENDSYLKAGQSDTDDIIQQLADMLNGKKKKQPNTLGNLGQDTAEAGGMAEALLKELASGGYLS